jgi:lipoprotein-anchoring transpeptidase ErfK/SrfK
VNRIEVAGICLVLATVYPTFSDAAVTRSHAPDPKVLTAQVLLDRLGFGPGVIDGHAGMSLGKALKGFQQSRGLDVTGLLDAPTIEALKAHAETPATIEVTLTTADLAGPFVGPIPKDPTDQAKLPAMGYSDAMEELAERFHTTKATLIALNSPTTPLRVGVAIKVPNVRPAATDYPAALKPEWRSMLVQLSVASDQPQAAKIVVDKSDGVLRVYDDQDKLVAQFPATMGSEHDPLPIGDWKIQGTAYLPPFHYNPDLFWDAKATDTKETLQPGPNGPVGVVWMDLDKEHYGIHGTPTPETIGRTASHGCIRLTNWDAARLSLMVKTGTPAVFEE